MLKISSCRNRQKLAKGACNSLESQVRQEEILLQQVQMQRWEQIERLCQLDQLRLKMESVTLPPLVFKLTPFDVSCIFRLMLFSETNVDAFLASFEKIVRALNWPETSYHILLQEAF